MKKLLVPDSTPLSLILGRFEFTPNVVDTANLQKEIETLQERVAALEQKQDRSSWWTRLRKRVR